MIVALLAACGGSKPAPAAPPANTASPQPPPPAPPPKPVAAMPNVPADCLRYQAVVEKLMMCPKVPPAARDALEKNVEQLSATWGKMAELPAAGLAQIADACKQATDAVAQSATSIGC